MPTTDTKNPNLFTVMKAILLLTTFWFVTLSFDLPIINSPSTDGGKCIKAHGISSAHFLPPDSSGIITSTFELADPASYQIRTVVIDPGHGGHDPGCSGHSTREKHVVLSIGKLLATAMKEQFPNLNVIMTRSTDVFVPLHERASLATNNKADLFISIHCNAFPNASARGTETYVLGLHATNENLEVAKRENESILLEDNYQENYGYEPNSPEAHIMFSMFQNAFLEQSISFAEKVQGHAQNHTGLKDRGVKQAGFLVLRHATMPSVLVETGYLTNGNDEAYLMTDQGQQSMAFALLNAFAEYKAEMEKSGNEAVATISYLEPKQTKPLVSKSFSNTPDSPKTTVQKRETPEPKPVQSSTVEVKMAASQERVVPAKLEDSPVSTSEPTAYTTNISPKRNTKITPNIPLQEEEKSSRPNSTPNIPAVTPKAPSIPENKTNNAIYCIQLAASPSLLDVKTGKWLNIDQTVEVLQEGSLYKYQVRNFATLDEANRVKSQFRSKGFYDAFVVAYLNGKRVDPRTLK